MTRVATMGTSSCATIAISGFKPEDKELNDLYLADKSSFKLKGMSVQEFYDEVLYPTQQDLGKSGEYPFDLLMDTIDESELRGKFIIATLAAFQNKYWGPKLEKRGFTKIDKTKNAIGTVNHIYTRNLNRKD